jgi:fumarylacetoacetate (FAA) hydrolase
MKLATLKDGTRDGKLVVVSRDLTRFTDASFLTPTLQAALDDWRRIAPHLAALAQSLEVGAVPSARFHEHDAHSPLPRAYQHIGCGDVFSGPRDPLGVASGEGASVSATVAGMIGDIARGASGNDARDGIVLVMLAAIAPEVSQAAFSPAAVTPDELGEGWGGRLAQPLHVSVNGKPVALQSGAGDLASAVSSAAKARPLHAGAIVAAEAGSDAQALRAGDTVRIEAKDAAGHSIFGAIEQLVSVNP